MPNHILPAGKTACSICLLLFLTSCRSIPSGVPDEYSTPLKARAYLAAVDILEACSAPQSICELAPGADLESITASPDGEVLLAFNDVFAYNPLRPASVSYIYSLAGQHIPESEIILTAGGYELSELIPNFYRGDSIPVDPVRKPEAVSIPQIVRPANGTSYPGGLSGRHIAIWPSHGWYYEHKLNRWEWQRARLFQTVEDLYPFSYVIPYLAPMLENAGASVFMPRERDIQSNEVVVDNDSGDSMPVLSDALAWDTVSPGFSIGNPPYDESDRPFLSGTSQTVATNPSPTDSALWVPEIPEAGEYAVYIAYQSLPRSVSDAHYTVRHSGGHSSFLVNQQIGGSTWIYLGTFHFNQGSSRSAGAVLLTNESQESGLISADAVRFGGGMGNIARNGQTSGRPRYMEGARYYMQYAGMPDSLVFDVTDGEDNDYIDDYRGRGEWANYLRGNPYGPNKDRTQGLGIPVDLSLAFHTDAGVTRRDTTIGTLLIYSTPGADSTDVFPDGVSRLANRDFSDILQTHIVDDIRSSYDSTWTRRSMWDKDYSEAFRPNIPAALLELLSHQNFEDMRYGLDPQFRFDVSRSIYKAMLKYLSDSYGYTYVVQPLPVSHLGAELQDGNKVRLSWRPVEDPLEPTAVATHYIVYSGYDSTGFDDGVRVDGLSFTTGPLEEGRVYKFRVAAANAGGVGFPSETVAAGILNPRAETVLIVNGFDRVSAPAAVDTGDITGFVSFLDEGVPDGVDMSFTGEQYDFRFESNWTDDDAPGHGASYADHESNLVAGNTHDFSVLHASSILQAGFNVVTVSDEVFEMESFDPVEYIAVDYLLGEERTTDPPGDKTGLRYAAFSEPMQNALARYTSKGGHVFVSGAYVGTDLFAGKPADSRDATFGRNILGFRWRTNHAARTGALSLLDKSGVPVRHFMYNTLFSPDMYRVEAPDAVEPVSAGGRTFMRYIENNMSAGVLYDAGTYRAVTLGFPFETILDVDMRHSLMNTVMDFLTSSSTQRESTN